MKKAKSKKRNKKTNQLSLLNLKVTEADRKIFAREANKYMKGNISAWLRLAGKSFRPDEKFILEGLYRLGKSSR